MAPHETTKDYYAILQILQSADSITIKTNYRRLAKAKHPDKDPTNPSATVEFQLVSESLLNCVCTNRIASFRKHTRPCLTPMPAVAMILDIHQSNASVRLVTILPLMVHLKDGLGQWTRVAKMRRGYSS